MAFVRPSTGDTFTQALAQQIIKALEGDAGFGQAINLTKLNDAGSYALTVQNLDAVNQYALNALNAAGGVVFQVAGGAAYFGVSPTFGAGAGIGHAGLADDAVEDNNILDGEVTLAKLPDGVFTANVAGRAKLANGFVNAAKVAADVATQAELDAHAALTAAGTHGSTTAATADKLVHRDAAGRAKVAAPGAATDIALKSTVTADIATHQALTSPHSAVSAATALRLIVRDAAGRAKVAAPGAATDIALKSTVTADIATHAALTSPHSATANPTASRLIVRDGVGRAAVAAPAAADDIARKDTVDAVQTNLNTHAALTAAGTHGSTTAATANKLVHRDAAGRAKVVAPAVAGDIALKSTVTADIATHAALTAAGTHGSTVAATADKLVHRDAAGRAKVVAPAVAGDIALKSTVTADIATHAALTSPHSATANPTASRLIVRDGVGRAAVAAPAAADDIARKDTVDAVQTNLNTHAALTAGAAHANRTRVFFIQASGSCPDGGGDQLACDEYGIILPNMGTHQVDGYGIIPNDFVPGGTLDMRPIFFPRGASGDIRIHGTFGANDCDNNFTVNFLGPATQALVVNQIKCASNLGISGGHVAAGNFIRLLIERQGDHADDDFAGVCHFCGWRLSYTADS